MWLANIWQGLTQFYARAKVYDYEYYRVNLTREEASVLYDLETRQDAANAIVARILQELRYVDARRFRVGIGLEGRLPEDDYARLVFCHWDQSEIGHLVEITKMKDSLLVSATDQFYHRYHRYRHLTPGA